MSALKNKSAYGGRGFLKRKPHSWTTSPVEYGKLQQVVLYIPGKEIHQLQYPDSVQHLFPINSAVLKNEITVIQKYFIKNKIQVINITGDKKQTPPNLFFARDLFWSTPKGIVLARMGSEIRKTEEKFIHKTLLENDVPFFHQIASPGIFEGADALWLTPKIILIGVNNRTDLIAFKELQNLFPDKKMIQIKLPREVQHLLGLIQFIGPKKVLVRSSIAPKELMKLLSKYKYQIVKIPEIDEVTHLQGMNIVTIKNNHIIMPDDCPVLESIYLKNKIKIVKKFKINELRKAAGGLACLTGILKRGN